MIHPHDSTIVQTLGRILIPVIQLYSIYVIFHAQYSPGGGFVGGVLFGTSLILTVLIFGAEHSRGFIQQIILRSDGLGLIVFAGIGILCILGGQAFLDYSALLVPGMDTASRRAIGIIGTQIGVAMDVAVVSVSIFMNLSPEEGFDESNH
jgi:multicomponent Na+:H+ antiporter subunit B